MNYQYLYDTLMERGRNRVCVSDKYYEMHHVIPKCEGGEENGETVPLTLKEHALAHLLRYKSTGLKGHLGAYGLLSRNNFSVFHRKDNASYAAKQLHKQWKESNPISYSESQREKGRKGAIASMEAGVSIFGMNADEQKAARAKGCKTTVENKLGMFSDEFRKYRCLKQQKRVEYNGVVYESCTQAAKSLGVSLATISNRIKSGKILVVKETV